MKNAAIIYKSNYGATKRYAQWIAEELGAPLFEASGVKPSSLLNYDAVVYGGGLYASGVNGVKLVVKNPCKSLAVFTVGLGNPETADYSSVIAKNFPPKILPKIKVFHLRGGIDYGNLKFIHKTVLSLVKKFADKSIKKGGTDLSGDEKLVLETYGKKLDYTDRAAIEPIVEYMRDLLSR